MGLIMAFWQFFSRKKPAVQFGPDAFSVGYKEFGRKKSPDKFEEAPRIFLARLELTLNNFVQYEKDKFLNPHKKASWCIEIVAGSFEGTPSNTTLAHRDSLKKPYLFLKIPDKSGFLIEIAPDQKLWLSRATMVQSLHPSTDGDVSHPLLFVAQNPSPLEVFQILDFDTARSSQGRTLLLDQFGEMLLTLALDEM